MWMVEQAPLRPLKLDLRNTGPAPAVRPPPYCGSIPSAVDGARCYSGPKPRPAGTAPGPAGLPRTLGPLPRISPDQATGPSRKPVPQTGGAHRAGREAPRSTEAPTPTRSGLPHSLPHPAPHTVRSPDTHTMSTIGDTMNYYVEKRGANHGLHIFLTIITCGFWAITGWPIAAIMGRKRTITGPNQPYYYPPQQLPQAPQQQYPPQPGYGPPPGPYNPPPGPYGTPPRK